MVWTTPTPRTTGELITASIWNTDLKDNLVLLKTSIANDGTIDATGGIFRTPKLWNHMESFIGANISAGVLTLNLQFYNEFYVPMNQNITSFVFANVPPVSGQFVTTCTLNLAGDGTPRTISWTITGGTPGIFRFSGGVLPPPPTSGNGRFDIIVLKTWDAYSWFAAIYGQNI